MGYTIPITNGIISMCYTDFNCPCCNHLHTEDDYYDRLSKSRYGLIYMACKGCKVKLGVTTSFKGDVVVWEKLKEEK